MDGAKYTDILPTGLNFTVNESASEPSSEQRYDLAHHCKMMDKQYVQDLLCPLMRRGLAVLSNMVLIERKYFVNIVYNKARMQDEYLVSLR